MRGSQLSDIGLANISGTHHLQKPVAAWPSFLCFLSSSNTILYRFQNLPPSTSSMTCLRLTSKEIQTQHAQCASSMIWQQGSPTRVSVWQIQLNALSQQGRRVAWSPPHVHHPGLPVGWEGSTHPLLRLGLRPAELLAQFTDLVGGGRPSPSGSEKSPSGQRPGGVGLGGRQGRREDGTEGACWRVTAGTETGIWNQLPRGRREPCDTGCPGSNPEGFSRSLGPARAQPVARALPPRYLVPLLL